MTADTAAAVAALRSLGLVDIVPVTALYVALDAGVARGLPDPR